MHNPFNETEMINKRKVEEKSSVFLLNSISQAINKLDTSQYVFGTNKTKAMAKQNMQWAVHHLSSSNLSNEEQNQHFNTIKANYRVRIFGESDIKSAVKIHIRSYGKLIKHENNAVQSKDINFLNALKNENKVLKVENKQLKVENKQLKVENKRLVNQGDFLKDKLMLSLQEQKEDRNFFRQEQIRIKKEHKQELKINREELKKERAAHKNDIEILMKNINEKKQEVDLKENIIHKASEENSQLHSKVKALEKTIEKQEIIITRKNSTINKQAYAITVYDQVHSDKQKPDGKRSVTEDSNVHNYAPSGSTLFRL